MPPVEPASEDGGEVQLTHSRGDGVIADEVAGGGLPTYDWSASTDTALHVDGVATETNGTPQDGTLREPANQVPPQVEQTDAEVDEGDVADTGDTCDGEDATEDGEAGVGPICQYSVSRGDDTWVCAPCRTPMHKSCALVHRVHSDTCPNCRQPMDLDEDVVIIQVIPGPPVCSDCGRVIAGITLEGSSCGHKVDARCLIKFNEENGERRPRFLKCPICRRLFPMDMYADEDEDDGNRPFDQTVSTRMAIGQFLDDSSDEADDPDDADYIPNE